MLFGFSRVPDSFERAAGTIFRALLDLFPSRVIRDIKIGVESQQCVFCRIERHRVEDEAWIFAAAGKENSRAIENIFEQVTKRALSSLLPGLHRAARFKSRSEDRRAGK